MAQYLPIVALTVLAVLFALLSLVASRLLAPRRTNAAKSAPYECGILPSKDTPERFPVSFYVVAMLFIMFDIEIIFTYPYAVDLVNLGTFGLIEMAAFSAVFFVAFVYMVARGALEWGPLQRIRAVDDDATPFVAAATTTRTTVRRVGLEGRPQPGSDAA